jgi:hypothetical protein
VFQQLCPIFLVISVSHCRVQDEDYAHQNNFSLCLLHSVGNLFKPVSCTFVERFSSQKVNANEKVSEMIYTLYFEITKSFVCINRFISARSVEALVQKLHQRCLSLPLVALVDITEHEGKYVVLYSAACGAGCRLSISIIWL